MKTPNKPQAHGGKDSGGGKDGGGGGGGADIHGGGGGGGGDADFHGARLKGSGIIVPYSGVGSHDGKVGGGENDGID